MTSLVCSYQQTHSYDWQTAEDSYDLNIHFFTLHVLLSSQSQFFQYSYAGKIQAVKVVSVLIRLLTCIKKPVQRTKLASKHRSNLPQLHYNNTSNRQKYNVNCFVNLT